MRFFQKKPIFDSIYSVYTSDNLKSCIIIQINYYEVHHIHMPFFIQLHFSV